MTLRDEVSRLCEEWEGEAEAIRSDYAGGYGDGADAGRLFARVDVCEEHARALREVLSRAEGEPAARSEVPRLLARVEELTGALRECLHALDFEWPDCDGCKGDPHPCTRCRARAALGEEER